MVYQNKNGNVKNQVMIGIDGNNSNQVKALKTRSINLNLIELHRIGNLLDRILVLLIGALESLALVTFATASLPLLR